MDLILEYMMDSILVHNMMD